MSLISQIKLSDLRKRSTAEIKVFPSVEVIGEEGEYIGTLIIPPVVGGMTIYDDIKTNAEYLGVRSNIPLPPSQREIPSSRDSGREKILANLAKGRLALKMKREAALGSV